MLINGFSLFELLLSLMLFSLLMSSLLTFYPIIQSNLIQKKRQLSLEIASKSLLNKLTKDIQRSGFMVNQDQQIELDIALIKNGGHCLILYYDYDRKGHITLSGESDSYAYRFKNNNLEFKKGILRCDGSGWIKLLDEQTHQLVSFLFIQKTKGIEIKGRIADRTQSVNSIHFTHFIKLYNDD